MIITDDMLVDFVRGELAHDDEMRVRAALARDAALHERLRDVQATLAVLRMPALMPRAEWRKVLRQRIDEAAEPVEPALPNDLGMVVDFLRGELDARTAQDIARRMARDPEFARFVRSVERTLRLLRPLELGGKVETQGTAARLAERVRSELAPEPSPQMRAVVDYVLGELGDDEFVALAKRMESDSAYAAERANLERLLGQVRALPLMDPRPEWRTRLRARLRSEHEHGKEQVRQARQSEALDMLRGELPSERVEAVRERVKGDDQAERELTDLARSMGQLRALPELLPSASFRKRIDEALARERTEVEHKRSAISGLLARRGKRGAMHELRPVVRHARGLRGCLGTWSETGTTRQTSMARSAREAYLRSDTSNERDEARRSLPQVTGREQVSRQPLSRAFRLGGGGVLGLLRARPLAAAVLFHAIMLGAAALVVPSVAAGAAPELLRAELVSQANIPRIEGPILGDASDLSEPGAPIEGKGEPGLVLLLPLANQVSLAMDTEVTDRVATVLREELRHNEEESRAESTRPLVLSRVRPDRGSVWFSLRRTPRERKAEYFPQDENGNYARLEPLLDYLIRAQRDDGSWAAGVGVEMPGVAEAERAGARWQVEARRIENAALALLALQGDGYSIRNDTSRQSVRRGVDFLLERLDRFGHASFVGVESDGRARARRVVQSNACATLALVEAYGLSGDMRVREGMIRALGGLLDAQLKAGAVRFEADQGGFPYAQADGLPTDEALAADEADMPTGAWVMQALDAATSLGFTDPRLEGARADFAAYVARHAEIRSQAHGKAESSGFLGVLSRPLSDLVPSSGERAVAMGTAAAMTAELAVGGRHFEETLHSQIDFLSQEHFRPSHRQSGAPGSYNYATCYEAWYFASLAMQQPMLRDHRQAQAWMSMLYRALWSEEWGKYVAEGPERGSFVAQGEEEELHGRVYGTALAALCIENAYRCRLGGNDR